MDANSKQGNNLPSRNHTYFYLWTYKQFQVQLEYFDLVHVTQKYLVCDLFDFLSALQEEQVEWDDVNKLLQHHGFKPVMFADPVENKNLSGMWYIRVHVNVHFQYTN